jgi:hypothetical protein
MNYTQSDQKENKSEQALHYVAAFYVYKCSMLGRRQYLMNFRHGNYNSAFYYYYLKIEKIYKMN